MLPRQLNAVVPQELRSHPRVFSCMGKKCVNTGECVHAMLIPAIRFTTLSAFKARRVMSSGCPMGVPATLRVPAAVAIPLIRVGRGTPLDILSVDENPAIDAWIPKGNR